MAQRASLKAPLKDSSRGRLLLLELAETLVNGRNITSPYQLDADLVTIDSPAIYWAHAHILVGINKSTTVINNPENLPGFTLYELFGGDYIGAFSYSGAACVEYTLNTTVASSGLFLVNDSTWQQAAQDGLLVSGVLPNATSAGQLPDSLCDNTASCTRSLGLDPSVMYSTIEFDQANISNPTNLTYRTLDPGAAECIQATPVEQAEGPSGQAYPAGLVEGQVMLSSLSAFSTPDPAPGELNFTASAHFDVVNASCIFYSMLPHNVPEADFQKFSLATISESALPTAMFYYSPPQPYNTSFCSLTTCNAHEGTWATQFGLGGANVFIVSSYSWPLVTDSDDISVDILVQAFGEEKCALLEPGLATSPATAPFRSSGVASTNSAPASPSSSSSSSAGAIAGGVVGGVVALAALAALALFLLHRRRRGRRQDNVEDGKLARQQLQQPLADVNSGKTSSTGTSGSGSKSALTDASSGDVSWAIDPATIRISQNPDGTPCKLGQGGFGMVYKAVQDDVRTVAVKVSQSSAQLGLSLSGDDRMSRSFWAETRRLADCRDANILTFYGAAVHNDDLWLVTEYCERGDLYRALNGKQAHVDTYLAWRRRGQYIALDVARGIHALHIRNIVHFDIKSPNILLTKGYDAKVGDVGLARRLLSTSQALDGGTGRGTWDWQSPECLLGQPSSTSADIYSFGVVLHELMSGEQPRRGQMREVRVPEEAPEEAVQLMEDCLQVDPSARPMAKQLVERLQALVQRSSWEGKRDPLMMSQ
ncbi:hypothetical protein WJX73_006039 [Symbiochloris irregularis]|uniref:Protein kinase domain-containing protein n=1 Tax=Symbiochloris irregularis TaxID=706552 RepID=A0AAW1P059_9CHLO